MKTNFAASLISCVLTVVSSIVGILASNIGTIQIISIGVAFLSGIISLIILYNSNRDSEYNKRILESLIKVNHPLNEMYDLTTEIIKKRVKEFSYYLRSASYGLGDYGRLHILKADNSDIEEFVIASKRCVVETYLAPNDKQESIVINDVFAMWGKDDLNSNWDIIVSKCKAHIAFRVSEIGNNYRVGFSFPGSHKGINMILLNHEPIGEAIVLNQDDFQSLLQLSVIKRGRFIREKVDVALREILQSEVF